jgi:hypothetical protein
LHKNATKCNETQGKWCKNKHGASKNIDTFETYQPPGQGFVPMVQLPLNYFPSHLGHNHGVGTRLLGAVVMLDGYGGLLGDTMGICG